MLTAYANYQFSIIHSPLDLRDLPTQLSSYQRIDMRRTRIEAELGVDLKHVEPRTEILGTSEQKNCEQMFGVVPIPVGYAGPLTVTFSNGQRSELHLPLATTEGALVASVNRGAKATVAGITIVRTVNHGMTRTIAFGIKNPSASLRASQESRIKNVRFSIEAIVNGIRNNERQWKAAAEATSGHLKVMSYDIDISKQYVFLTTAFDTDEAMGMNMVTIASQAIADWLTANVEGTECVTVAGNVDSDKKPSRRTHERGRGFDVTCVADVSPETIRDVLKTTPEALLRVADAKLVIGSSLAGAIGHNLHAANVVAALYLATGQDVAHTVEGSLADTEVIQHGGSLRIQVRLPALLVGVRGGGTELPAQAQCRALLMKNKSGLPGKQQLAESVAAAVLAGELSLLAAQATNTLAKAHEKLGR